MKLNLKLDKNGEAQLKKAIEQKFAKFAGQCVERLHSEVTKRTPVNTGRTLASWDWSFNRNHAYDAGPYEVYMYGELQPTNRLPVGSEMERAWAQHHTDQSRDAMKKSLLTNPYKVVWMTNGAELDSLYLTNKDGKPNPLQQGPGTRAYYQEYGIIPGYDIDADELDVFFPRGFAMLRQSIEVIKNSPKN